MAYRLGIMFGVLVALADVRLRELMQSLHVD